MGNKTQFMEKSMEERARIQTQTIKDIKQKCLADAVYDPPAGPESCPRVFDDLSCWEPATAGQLVIKPCPTYFNGFYSENSMSKLCTSNGTWYFNEEYGRQWTNYTECATKPDYLSHHLFNQHPDMLNYTDNYLIQLWTPVIKQMSQTGYCISLSALIIALIIFCSIRKLRTCPRNILHMHLFVSFVLKAVAWAAMDLMPQNLLLPSNHASWRCKLVTTLWQYLTLANYTWVTMEGLYLFCLIHLAILSDNSRITLYILIGWGFPVAFVAAWATVRGIKEDVYCWRVHLNEGYFWIIRSPTIFLVLMNAVLFVFIIYVLKQKLTASISPETRRYRKLARSTLVLMPLFGFHYTLLLGFSASINQHRVLELIWLFWDQFFASFQGFSVALLYCFVNAEVRQELRKNARNLYYRHFGVPSGTNSRARINSTRNLGRSSVQSTTLLEKTSTSRTPSPKFRGPSGEPLVAIKLQPHTEETLSETVDDATVAMLTRQSHNDVISKQQNCPPKTTMTAKNGQDESAEDANSELLMEHQL